MSAHEVPDDEMLADGDRIGRLVILRDIDGQMNALAAGDVAAICETNEGALLMLQGGRMVDVLTALPVVVGVKGGSAMSNLPSLPLQPWLRFRLVTLTGGVFWFKLPYALQQFSCLRPANTSWRCRLQLHDVSSAETLASKSDLSL